MAFLDYLANSVKSGGNLAGGLQNYVGDQLARKTTAAGAPSGGFCGKQPSVASEAFPGTYSPIKNFTPGARPTTQGFEGAQTTGGGPNPLAGQVVGAAVKGIGSLLGKL